MAIDERDVLGKAGSIGMPSRSAASTASATITAAPPHQGAATARSAAWTTPRRRPRDIRSGSRTRRNPQRSRCSPHRSGCVCPHRHRRSAPTRAVRSPAPVFTIIGVAIASSRDLDQDRRAGRFCPSRASASSSCNRSSNRRAAAEPGRDHPCAARDRDLDSEVCPTGRSCSRHACEHVERERAWWRLAVPRRFRVRAPASPATIGSGASRSLPGECDQPRCIDTAPLAQLDIARTPAALPRARRHRSR